MITIGVVSQAAPVWAPLSAGQLVQELDVDRQRICRIGQLPALQLGHYMLAKPGVADRIAPVDQFFLLGVADRRKAWVIRRVHR